jgi:hypothetical protein
VFPCGCRQKRIARLKAYSEGQKKVRHEGKKALADTRPRNKVWNGTVWVHVSALKYTASKTLGTVHSAVQLLHWMDLMS